MTLQELDVAIFEGERLIQHWPCTRAAMPDGAPGVVWRGVLYRLLDGGRIDVAPPTGEPDGVPYAILGGEEASWVLVQGPQSALRQAEAALAAAGIHAARNGRWLGQLIDGVGFDWFIRCAGRLDENLIASLLGAPQATAEPDPTARAMVLEQRLAILLADIAQLRQGAAVSARQPAEPAADHLLQASLAETAQALSSVNAELDRTQAELAQLRHTRSASAAPPAKVEHEVLALLQALRPNLTLLRDSTTVAFGEFGSRTGFYRAIAELPESGARPDGWKALRGAERWWERHVSNGQNNTGRAYARFETAERRWALLLSWKAEQALDISWLQSL